MPEFFFLFILHPKHVIKLLGYFQGITARGMIEMPAESEITPQDPFQEETNDVDEFSLPVENDTILINDPIGEMLDIDVTETFPHDDDKEEEYDEDEDKE